MAVARSVYTQTHSPLLGHANPMKTYQIACIPGDGIGKEVIPAALHTRDLGGTATTAQVTDAVCAAIARASHD